MDAFDAFTVDVLDQDELQRKSPQKSLDSLNERLKYPNFKQLRDHTRGSNYVTDYQLRVYNYICKSHNWFRVPTL